MNKQKPIKMKFSPIYRKNIQEDFKQDMHTCERTTCQKVMPTKKYVDSTCPYCSKKQITIQNLESKKNVGN